MQIQEITFLQNPKVAERFTTVEVGTLPVHPVLEHHMAARRMGFSSVTKKTEHSVYHEAAFNI